MKSLFLRKNFTSIKGLRAHRSIIMGMLVMILIASIILHFYNINQQTAQISNYYENVINGGHEYSADDVDELKEESSLLLVVFWTSLTAFIASLIFFPSQIAKYLIESLTKIKSHAEILASGDLSKRITNIKNKDEFGDIFWAMNDVTDQFEALVKELTTSIDYISEKKFFRPVLSKGLNGAFAIRLKHVDETLKEYSGKLIEEKRILEVKEEKLLKSIDII